MFKRTSVRYCPGSYPPELLELFDPNTTNQDTFAPCVVCSWWHVELAFWNHLNETPTGISQTTNQQFHYAFKDACFPSPRWSLVVYFHPPSAGSFGVSKSAFDVIKALTVEFRWHPSSLCKSSKNPRNMKHVLQSHEHSQERSTQYSSILCSHWVLPFISKAETLRRHVLVLASENNTVCSEAYAARVQEQMKDTCRHACRNGCRN